MACSMWHYAMFLCSVILISQLYGVCGRGGVITLDEDNWQEMLSKEWMVEFYAPWCPACKTLQPEWEKFSSSSSKLGISVGKVDITTSPGLSGRFLVTALPTIFHVYDGEFRQYRGPRDIGSFVSFIEEKKWKTMEAIPSWKSPGSVQMSVVSFFFKLSQLLRTVHNNLMEEYGLPTWGSYLIFACGTILIGAILGLAFVCIIDLIYPPKPLPRVPSVPHDLKKKNEKEGNFHDSGDEMEEGEDQDDLVDEVDEAADSGSGDSDAELKDNEGSPNVRKRKPRKAD